jgi:gluconate 2-dehydrogenase gamma chain
MSENTIGHPEEAERSEADEGSAFSQPPTQISRRDALKAFTAAVPAAGLVAFATPEAERIGRFMESLDQQGAQQAFVPKFFTAHELRTVRMLVDYIIPRDEKTGSANDAKVPEYMDFVLNDTFMTSDPNRVSFRGGLAWLDLECRRRFNGKTFLTSTDPERRQVLDDIAWPRRARPEMAVGVAFFSRARDMTASGFYSSKLGWQDLQYMGHVFNPKWDGCPPAANAKLGVSQDVMAVRVKPEKG